MISSNTMAISITGIIDSILKAMKRARKTANETRNMTDELQATLGMGYCSTAINSYF